MISIIWRSLLFIGFLAFPGFPFRMALFTLQEAPSQVSILSPHPGQAVQGAVPININTVVDGFKSSEVYFAYANNPTGSWFYIAQSNEPVNGVMLEWDTTLITDGNYDLKLIVKLQDDTQQETVVRGIRVRNYSPVETDTPTPVLPTSTPLPGEIPAPTATSTPTITLTPTITPTSTQLPPNPAELPSNRIFSSLGIGSLAVLGAFAFLGIYTWIRNWIRNREVG